MGVLHNHGGKKAGSRTLSTSPMRVRWTNRSLAVFWE
jgi:hypothetical protein